MVLSALLATGLAIPGIPRYAAVLVCAGALIPLGALFVANRKLVALRDGALYALIAAGIAALFWAPFQGQVDTNSLYVHRLTQILAPLTLGCANMTLLAAGIGASRERRLVLTRRFSTLAWFLWLPLTVAYLSTLAWAHAAWFVAVDSVALATMAVVHVTLFSLLAEVYDRWASS